MSKRVQYSFTVHRSSETTFLGAVGELQFQVFEYRMKAEYGVDLEFTSMQHNSARWIAKDDVKHIKTDSRAMLVEDLDGNPVLLFEK
ncbi:hypothetical protein GCM10020331_070800 [Ectobacillus funiculus]